LISAFDFNWEDVKKAKEKREREKQNEKDYAMFQKREAEYRYMEVVRNNNF